jgi:FkbM family methyltransferase
MNIVDAGARYGIHPSFKSIFDISRFYLFEPEPIEFNRLVKKFSENSNVKVSNLALSNRKDNLKLRINQHTALSTLKNLGSYINEENYKFDEFREVNSVNVQAESIDNFFSNSKVDFLKLDVEGFELNVLEGAQFQLENNIVGVRSEVTFVDMHDNGASFGKIHDFLLSKNFELLNLDYNGQGFPLSNITNPKKFGKLISTDAVWIKKLKYLKDEPTKLENYLNIVVFCLINGATDVAVAILLELTKTMKFLESLHLEKIKFIKKNLALTCKELMYNPNIDLHMIQQIWSTIFSENFPKLADFWVIFDDEN